MSWREQLFSVRALYAESRCRPPSAWLSSAEEDHLRSIARPERARPWLAGRCAAKRILLDLLAHCVSPDQLHIESLDGRGRGARPRVFLAGRLQPWSLSLSHAGDSIYAAASLSAATRLGVDVVELDCVARQAIEYWFTPYERQWCRRIGRDWAFALVWAIKEARYKAEHEGEAFAPRSLDLQDVLRAEHPACQPIFHSRSAASWTLNHGGRHFAAQCDRGVLRAFVAVQTMPHHQRCRAGLQRSPGFPGRKRPAPLHYFPRDQYSSQRQLRQELEK